MCLNILKAAIKCTTLIKNVKRFPYYAHIYLKYTDFCKSIREASLHVVHLENHMWTNVKLYREISVVS